MTKQSRIWFVAGMILALTLRFAFLGSKSLWLDEAFSLDVAGRTAAEITSGQSDRIHPPLYYLGLHYWIDLAGQEEAVLRFPSAIFSMINIGLLYALARRLFDENIAMCAAIFLAFSPLDLWYAQEARMYIFVSTAGLLIVTGLVWSNVVGTLMALSGLLLGLFLDYTMIPLWAGLSGVWLGYWFVSGLRRLALVPWAVSLIAWWFYQPWLPRLQAYAVQFNRIHAINRVRLLFSLPEFNPGQFVILLGVASTGFAFLAAMLLFLLRRPTTRRPLVAIHLLGFSALTALVAVPRFYAAKRVLVTGWPYLILLVAWSLINLDNRLRRKVWNAILGLSLAACLLGLATPKDAWRDAVLYVNQNSSPNDVAWIEPGYNAIPYLYYDPILLPADRSSSLAETASTDTWFIAERFPGQPVPASVDEAWLDDNLKLVERVPLYRLEVRRYRPYEDAVGDG